MLDTVQRVRHLIQSVYNPATYIPVTLYFQEVKNSKQPEKHECILCPDRINDKGLNNQIQILKYTFFYKCQKYCII